MDKPLINKLDSSHIYGKGWHCKQDFNGASGDKYSRSDWVVSVLNLQVC